ncbi:MAG: mandelate racemase/muconate lactonizing enzyme family protein [Anaerolineae bacterium]|nr:mandelate racemase/muconate lactonizing enzyme family protein [Anaerolineae bacterium]
MLIKKLDVYPLEFLEAVDNYSTRYVVLVRIEAQDGTVGWGECFSLFREATAAIEALIKAGLGSIVIGKDAYDIETHWQAMRERAWWYGDAGGIAAFAISAIDMALWDLKGKLLKLNLSQMLGGVQTESLPVCASSHPKAAKIDDMAEELAGHIKAGFKFVKVGFGKKGESNLGVDAERDIYFVKTVRAAIGPKAGFIVDVGARCRWDIPRAVYTAQAMQASNLTWMEDPFHPDNFNGFHHLRAAVPGMRIGFGERLYNVYDYKRALEAGVCDVLLIDAGRAEGVTGMWKVIQMAARHNVAINAHSFSSAINTAASIHLSLCAPLRILFELKPIETAMHHELVRNPVWHVDGQIYAPEGYGLGVDVMEDAVERFTIRF